MNTIYSYNLKQNDLTPIPVSISDTDNYKGLHQAFHFPRHCLLAHLIQKCGLHFAEYEKLVIIWDEKIYFVRKGVTF